MPDHQRSAHQLIVALSDRRYRVERPFGHWPANSGFVTDVAVDARGHVFVLLRHDPLTQPEDARVIALDPEGALIGAFGGPEIADAHLMTVSPDGTLLVVDRDMHEVIRFSAEGRRIAGLGRRGGPGAPFNHPSDVAVAASGDIYVSDGYAASQVHRFAADGRHLSSWGGQGAGPDQFGEPHALTTLTDGRVAVVDRIHNRVQIFDAGGRALASIDGFYRPVAIWADAEDFLHVTDSTPNLHLLSPAGERIGRCRPVLNGAHGISGNARGDLFLAESNPSRVTRLVRL